MAPVALRSLAVGRLMVSVCVRARVLDPQPLSTKLFFLSGKMVRDDLLQGVSPANLKLPFSELTTIRRLLKGPMGCPNLPTFSTLGTFRSE